MGREEQVINDDKSVIQENTHLAASTECPFQEPPCKASLNVWQTFLFNLCNQGEGKFQAKCFLSNSFLPVLFKESEWVVEFLGIVA